MKKVMACENNKILIFGATGYLGKYMVKASVSLGHPTYAYARSIKPITDPSNLELHKEYEAMGVTVFQRFIPVGFGDDPKRASVLPPFEATHENRRVIRRATEAAGIPYTYVCGNTFAVYFVDCLLQPREEREEVIVYGTGKVKGKYASGALYF
ncbi:unnamed protein product [Malus baccata var. baccata]